MNLFWQGPRKRLLSDSSKKENPKVHEECIHASLKENMVHPEIKTSDPESTKRMTNNNRTGEESHVERAQSHDTVASSSGSISVSPLLDRNKIVNNVSGSRDKKIHAKQIMQEQLELEASLGLILKDLEVSRKSDDIAAVRKPLKGSVHRERRPLSVNNLANNAHQNKLPFESQNLTKTLELVAKNHSENSTRASPRRVVPSGEAKIVTTRSNQEKNEQTSVDTQAVVRTSVSRIHRERDVEAPLELDVLKHVRVQHGCCLCDGFKRKRFICLSIAMAFVFIVTIGAVVTSSIFLFGESSEKKYNPKTPISSSLRANTPQEERAADSSKYFVPTLSNHTGSESNNALGEEEFDDDEEIYLELNYYLENSFERNEDDVGQDLTMEDTVVKDTANETIQS